MKATFVSKEKNVITFTMEFAAEEFTAAIESAYKKERGKIQVPGFRKGKAPRSIIERMYGSSVFFDTAIDDMMNMTYPTALGELNITPINNPDVKFGEEMIEQGKGFTVTVSVEVAPEIEPKDYMGVEVERKIRVVTDEDVENQLQNEQKKAARMVTVERAAQEGDTVVLDYAGFCEGEQFEGGTAENQTLKLGSGQFIPGFEDQLVGVSAGESKDVEVTFPEEYHADNLAGKPATFKCTVHEVKEEQLPELNDDFALDVSDFDTLAEFKADIKAKLEESAKKSADAVCRNDIMEKVCENNPVDVPQIMIDDEAEQMLQEFGQNLQYQGLTLEMYCKYIGQTQDQIKESFKADAEKRAASRIVIKGIGIAEKIEVSEEEVEKEYADLAEQYGMEVEAVKKYFAGQTSLIEDDIRSRKTVDLIVANAKITDVAEEALTAAAEQ